jgi:hypothetical protein
VPERTTASSRSEKSAEIVVVGGKAAKSYAYDGDRLVLRGGLSTHKHVFKSELKSG